MVRKWITCVALFIPVFFACAQDQSIENVIIIITTDGLRWQEVFQGMDAAIAADPTFNQKDSAGIFKMYWSDKPVERRRKLMPFLWDTLSSKGQVYGNRLLGSNVNVANPYWFSYPGYNELFTGFADTSINTNEYPPNPNTTLLEYIHQQKRFKGKVAAFGAWSAFDRIFNEQRCGFPVICGNDLIGSAHPDIEQQMLNTLKTDAHTPFPEEALDVFTHYAALDYLRKQKPRVLYIAYGETDEWAHEGHYKDYLDATRKVDKWIGDIWRFVENSRQYKGKTLLFITVDHGRGDKVKKEWTSHNNKIAGADEIWFAIIGPGIPAKGEIQNGPQLYQKQFAQTIAHLLGLNFSANHPIAEGIKITK